MIASVLECLQTCIRQVLEPILKIIIVIAVFKLQQNIKNIKLVKPLQLFKRVRSHSWQLVRIVLLCISTNFSPQVVVGLHRNFEHAFLTLADSTNRDLNLSIEHDVANQASCKKQTKVVRGPYLISQRINVNAERPPEICKHQPLLFKSEFTYPDQDPPLSNVNQAQPSSTTDHNHGTLLPCYHLQI